MAVINEIQDRGNTVAASNDSAKNHTPLKEGMNGDESKPKEMSESSPSSNTAKDDVLEPTTQNKEPDNLMKLMSADADDSDEEDESLVERIIGLSEMLPDSVCEKSAFLFNKIVSFTKKSYSLSRQITWVVVSTSLILFAPVMIQVEKFNVEEMMKQDRDRLLLGPRSNLAGPLPTSPGMPPPPTR